MTVLRPMRPEAYAPYLKTAIAGYAEDNVASGRWPKNRARQLARRAFRALLPRGLATPGHHLFEIMTTNAGPTIGYVWVALEERNGTRSAFVYDLEIEESHRRQGHAERAFRALESIVVALGSSSIGLHVFGHNRAAQALYRKLGYAVIDINMQKQLVDPA